MGSLCAASVLLHNSPAPLQEGLCRFDLSGCSELQQDAQRLMLTTQQPLRVKLGVQRAFSTAAKPKPGCLKKPIEKRTAVRLSSYAAVLSPLDSFQSLPVGNQSRNHYGDHTRFPDLSTASFAGKIVEKSTPVQPRKTYLHPAKSSPGGGKELPGNRGIRITLERQSESHRGCRRPPLDRR